MTQEEKIYWMSVLQKEGFHVSPSTVVIDSLDKRLKENRNIGWLYILRNPLYKKALLKIGKTSRVPYKRLKELSGSTGVPGNFQLVYYVHVCDHHVAELQAHQILQSYRLKENKEFFTVPVSKAIRTLDEVANIYPVMVGSGRSRTVLAQDYGESIVVRCEDCGARLRKRNLPVRIKAKCPDCGKEV